MLPQMLYSLLQRKPCRHTECLWIVFNSSCSSVNIFSKSSIFIIEAKKNPVRRREHNVNALQMLLYKILQCVCIHTQVYNLFIFLNTVWIQGSENQYAYTICVSVKNKKLLSVQIYWNMLLHAKSSILGPITLKVKCCQKHTNNSIYSLLFV